jgi:purine-binding chemotaxis protein CheW
MIETNNIACDQILVFTLDDQSYALLLKAVVKVIHAIEIRHLPKAPDIINGIINVKGLIIPVVDIRRRFGLEPQEIELSDRLIISVAGKRVIAILVTSVTGIIDMKPGQIELSEKTIPFAENMKGVAKIDDGLVLIYDLEHFLSLEEELVLDKAMKIKSK